jgi:acylphosphatase
MTVTRRLLVSGRVQRVGYRAFAAGAARREGLRGFVRNLADGRVEAVGEGDREAMDRFQRALHQGPPLSRVHGVTVEDVAPLDVAGGFVVRT